MTGNAKVKVNMAAWNTRDDCTVSAGCGYPDLPTRAALRLILDALGSSVPVWGISDADPYGLEIMATYKFGSQALLHMSDQLKCRCLVALGP